MGLLTIQVMALLTEGDLELAAKVLEKLRELRRDVSHWDASFTYHQLSSWLALFRDQPDLALHHVNAALIAAENVGCILYDVRAFHMAVQVHLARRDVREAQHFLHRAAESAERIGSAWLDFAHRMTEAQLANCRGDK